MMTTRPRPTHLALFDLMRVAIAAGYVALGCFFVLSPRASLMMPAEIAPYFGGALVAYGLFRMFRAIKLWRQASKPVLELGEED